MPSTTKNRPCGGLATVRKEKVTLPRAPWDPPETDDEAESVQMVDQKHGPRALHRDTIMAIIKAADRPLTIREIHEALRIDTTTCRIRNFLDHMQNSGLVVSRLSDQRNATHSRLRVYEAAGQ